MKRLWIVICFLLFGITSYAKEKEPEELYARSAVLMDADSGRVLFEKNGYEEKAMASTTKIMTCILALERGDPDAVITVSENAVKQPKVHLGMRREEQFYLKDLLYSLMLESHNDSAVAIAEHIGGSVEGFAALMNEKAAKLGCEKTHFVTPNGLDAADEQGKHATTAAELARIMSYCIKESPQKEQFLEITQTASYGFCDVSGNRSFSCNNHNAFLNMMEGAVSGKTGFTGDAGYCYVGAVESEGRTFVVALLACGWPNHKGYKWSDTRKLMEYGIRNYEYREVSAKQEFPQVKVENGIPETGNLFAGAEVGMMLEAEKSEQNIRLLLHDEETLERKESFKRTVKAPVKRGDEAGTVSYFLKDKLVKQYLVVFTETVEEKNFPWYFRKLAEKWMLL